MFLKNGARWVRRDFLIFVKIKVSSYNLLKSVEGKNTSTYLTATSQKLPGKANIRLSHLSNERHEHSCHCGEVSALEDKPGGADSENISHKPAPRHSTQDQLTVDPWWPMFVQPSSGMDLLALLAGPVYCRQSSVVLYLYLTPTHPIHLHTFQSYIL